MSVSRETQDERAAIEKAIKLSGRPGFHDQPMRDAAREALDALVARLERVEEAAAEDRKRYGAKFTAITAALGYATEAEQALLDDDTETGHYLAKVISILVDA